MIIATVNSKGGVGKSTIAVHLALWLHEQGQKTVLVDADYQGSSSQWGHEAAPDLPILRLNDPDEIIQKVNQCKQTYRYIILDGPGGADGITRSLLLVTDLAVIPCGPSLLDVRSASVAISVLESARIVRDGKPAALFVCNKIRLHARLSHDLLQFAEGLGIPFAKTALRLREVYADAVTHKTAAWKLGYRAKEAGQEIKALFQEVIADEHQIAPQLNGRTLSKTTGISTRTVSSPV